MREPDYASSEAERCNGTKTRPIVLSIGFSVWQDLGYATKSALGAPSVIIREREGFPEVILPCSLCEEGAPLSLYLSIGVDGASVMSSHYIPNHSEVMNSTQKRQQHSFLLL